MRPSFLPQLINGPFEDPGVFVPLAFRKRALLFDLGDLHRLTAGDLIKTSHGFVTHTHMDHFIGFDQLLRLLLGRPRRLGLFGPPGFLQNVAARLQSYTWNLVRNYDEGLVIEATEIEAGRRTTQSFDCRSGFAPSTPRVVAGDDPVIHREPSFEVRTAMLDHQIPCLAFALGERYHINILNAQLQTLGLAAGPWVGRFKEMLYQEAAPETRIDVPGIDPQQPPQTWTLQELADRVTRITPGQKIAYVADAGYSPANEEKIVSLARDADHLFIEAAFLHCHRDIAQAKSHLTAQQAGTIARSAGVRKMTVFHHSPRYEDQPHLLAEEARRAFEA